MKNNKIHFTKRASKYWITGLVKRILNIGKSAPSINRNLIIPKLNIASKPALCPEDTTMALKLQLTNSNIQPTTPATIKFTGEDEPGLYLLFGNDTYNKAIQVPENGFMLNEELSRSMAFQG